MRDNMALVDTISILFLLFCGFTLHVAADGCQISNVTSTSTERITLRYCDEPAVICYHGDKKTWGIREAHTACKQLNFKGGWPKQQDIRQVDSIRSLNNFDCNEGVSDLNNCEFEVTDVCEDQVAAAVECYNSFEVQLVGGATPNTGRVEVKYDDQWANVCYQTSESFSKDWSFTNAQVVCKEVGFPGTMFAKQSGQGNGTRTHIVNGYSCRKDMLQRNVSLADCYPDPPAPRAQDSISSCDLGTKVMNNEAVVICAAPGYIGCYDGITDVTHRMSLPNMTINRCRHHCRNSNYQYAMLHNGDTCSCAHRRPDHNTRIEDVMCRTECNGNGFEICGDTTKISAYDAYSGICQDPLNKGDVYYYGDVFDAFECDPGTEPVTATAIQCVMGSDPNQFVWNGTTSVVCIVYNGTCQDPLNKGDVYYVGDVFDAFECDPGMEPVNATDIQCVIRSDPDQFMWNGTTSVVCIREQANADDNRLIIGIALGLAASFVILGLVGFAIVYNKKKRGIYSVLAATMNESLNMTSEVNEQGRRTAVGNIGRNSSQDQSSSQTASERASEDTIDGSLESTEASNLLPIVPCNSDIDTMKEHDISATSEHGLISGEKMGLERQTTDCKLRTVGNMGRNSSEGQSSSQAPPDSVISSTEASKFLPVIVPKGHSTSDIETMKERDISLPPGRGLISKEKFGLDMETPGGKLKVNVEFESFSPDAKPNAVLLVRTPSGAEMLNYRLRPRQKDSQNGAISEEKRSDSTLSLKQIE